MKTCKGCGKHSNSYSARTISSKKKSTKITTLFKTKKRSGNFLK